MIFLFIKLSLIRKSTLNLIVKLYTSSVLVTYNFLENEVNKTKMNTLNLSHMVYINAHIETLIFEDWFSKLK